MGLGIGIYCERCENQIECTQYLVKEGGWKNNENYNLCKDCLREIERRKWDEEHKDI